MASSRTFYFKKKISVSCAEKEKEEEGAENTIGLLSTEAVASHRDILNVVSTGPSGTGPL